MKVISKRRQRLFSFTCNSLSDIFPAFPPPTPAENKDSFSESGILVSRAVELTIDEVTLKPAGQPRQQQVGGGARRPIFRLNSMFSVFSLVVGVKLNVSFWMNSFMNATLKLNVRLVHDWVVLFVLFMPPVFSLS